MCALTVQGCIRPGVDAPVPAPTPALAPEIACTNGIWSPTSDQPLPFGYLACTTNADCTVVHSGDACERTSTFAQRFAPCIALGARTCTATEASAEAGMDVPTSARCNQDGFCELVL